MDNSSLTANATISHYRIIKKIGAGGMGEVYLARDTELDRLVAIKILPADLASDQERLQRFIQEAKAASALNHPHIVTIHEIGTTGTSRFIATEFIDGDTLRARISSGSLSLGEILDIATQTASALAAAHEAGIIHRDIKPENIIVRRDGYSKLLDFGLAKLTLPKESDPEDETQALLKTKLGVVMGTAAYMSPEQARGQSVDARTDIFSLGAVIYEILTRRRPFDGETFSDILAAILKTEPPAITHFSPGTPVELVRIVGKALCKDRERRYQNVKDMLHDLKALKQELEFAARFEPPATPELTGGAQTVSKKIQSSLRLKAETVEAQSKPGENHLVTRLKHHKLATAVVLTMLAVGIVGLAGYLRSGNTEEAIDSIAVLPFINENNDPDTEYLSDGISDSIIDRLSKLSNLRVASFSSALRYKRQPIDPLAVGRDLNVHAVLIGWMTKRGDDLSVRTELVNVRDNRRLWGGQYNNHKLADLLHVQEEIAREISDNLRLRLTSQDQQRLARRETQSSEAYQLYLKGRFYWNKYTEDGFRKSIAYFREAVEKDPGYALAYSGMADSYSLLGELSAAPPQEVFPQARSYAQKALAIDEALPEAHLSLGIVSLFYDWDLPNAEKELRRAKELDPNNPEVHHFYGHYLQFAGRLNEAVAEIQRGLELDPTSLIINAELGWAHYVRRQYDAAIAQLLKTLELDPNFVTASLWLAQAYETEAHAPGGPR